MCLLEFLLEIGVFYALLHVAPPFIARRIERLIEWIRGEQDDDG